MTVANEEAIQIIVPSKVKRQIQLMALQNNQTMRTFILNALKKQGVNVSEDDLADRRKPKRK